MRKITLLGALFMLIFSTSCDKGGDGEDLGAERRFELYFTYYNPSGNDPTVILDSAFDTNEDVNIDSTAVIARVVGDGDVEVTFNNVTLVTERDGQQINYNIDDVTTEYLINDVWRLDTEFETFISKAVDMDLVMVLDASSSLGDNFPVIQSYVKKLAKEIKDEIADVSFGLVDFNDDINCQSITDNLGIIDSHIDSIKLERNTSLYDAVDKGIELLQGSNARTKAMLTFTDGLDNNSDLINNSPTKLADRMTVGVAGSPIASFTIGMGNDIDEVAMKQLAVNGGKASFPQNVEQLEGVFEDFSKTIGAVHSLTYRRNDQARTFEDAQNIRFVIKATPK